VIVSEVVHCPVCSTEYPAGTSICVNDSSILIDGPVPEETSRDLAEPEGLDRRPDEIGRLEVVPMETDAKEEQVDLFEYEEHPRRMVLVVMVPEDAPGLMERLETEGVGSRLGEPTDDGGVEVLIHEMNVQQAQAILTDYTGDPSLVDDIDLVEKDDDDDRGYALVSRGSGGVVANVDRLRGAGIDVRLELGEEGVQQPWAIHCPWEDVERARELLGVQR
jgi:hypothetical protein